MDESTETVSMAESTQALAAKRLALLAGHFASFALASLVAAVVITNGPHGAWPSLAKVGLSIGLADAVFERLLDWVAVPPKWVSTTLFLILANAALFGIADRMGIQDPTLQFGIDGFVQALGGSIIVVALSIVLRRIAGLLGRRRGTAQP